MRLEGLWATYLHGVTCNTVIVTDVDSRERGCKFAEERG
jgi:hypothetical protein